MVAAVASPSPTALSSHAAGCGGGGVLDARALRAEARLTAKAMAAPDAASGLTGLEAYKGALDLMEGSPPSDFDGADETDETVKEGGVLSWEHASIEAVSPGAVQAYTA